MTPDVNLYGGFKIRPSKNTTLVRPQHDPHTTLRVMTENHTTLIRPQYDRVRPWQDPTTTPYFWS